MTIKNNYKTPEMEQFDIMAELNFMSVADTPNDNYIGDNPLGDI